MKVRRCVPVFCSAVRTRRRISVVNLAWECAARMMLPSSRENTLNNSHIRRTQFRNRDSPRCACIARRDSWVLELLDNPFPHRA